ncbi:hypothetical protein [Mycolicibacterium bacteremicum]|uniref:Uncharacterized protein n=1 Tax=Mycolicibacterium bacteremicum TaxID=564198 RepID=A0A1W9Z0G4_MYCBA|nr:hypothetical protein [Mycolicibacterium bacteremicum]MCV7434790.1 hypothetical protein [Mycolicibacterium bacteremicum]ORA05785.1 hypothetical protein BST17_08470 [Mycolicibacterium bacteremicum]
MTGFGSPEFWSGVSGPGIATIGAVILIVALSRGWLVIGKQYDAQVARADKAEDTNQMLTEALTKKNATDELATTILRTVRNELATKDHS